MEPFNFNRHRQCHTEGLHILTIGSATIHASSNQLDYDGFALVINLSGFSYGSGQLVEGLRGGEALVPSFIKGFPKAKQVDPPELTIEWKDGGAPALTKADWTRLVKDLGRIKGKVLIHCMGGHGRTGTALCVLLAIVNGPGKDHVKWLRKHYCEKVVESKAQFDYLREFGITSTCEPRPLIVHQSSFDFTKSSFNPTQESYNLTKAPAKIGFDSHESFCPMYKCILCCRSRIAAYFYQTFADMSGFCWECHQLAHKTNPDTIQSA